MARVIEVPAYWKNGSGPDICIDMQGMRACVGADGNGYIWDAGTPDGCGTHLNISYEDLRRLIATPGEFASYRDLTQKSDAKAQVPGWQPIETAPKDGTIIDLWGPVRKREPGCEWIGEAHGWATDPEWINVYTGKKFPRGIFTHWMPVPAGPEDER